MNKLYIDIKNLQTLLFERQQIIALLNNRQLWGQIPLAQRFEIVDSSEFVILMGKDFTEQTRQLLEVEIEAMMATIQ